MTRIVRTTTGNVAVGRRLLPTNTTIVLSQREASRIPASAFSSGLTDLGPGLIFSAPVTLLSLDTDAEVAATITPGFPGRVVAAFAVVSTAVTTAARVVNLQVEIEGEPVTGGVLPITSAAATPAGKVLPASNISDIEPLGHAGSNYFDADDDITFVVSGAPTTHAEGAVLFGVLLAPAYKPGPAEV